METVAHTKPRSVEEYLSSFSEKQKVVLQRLREIVRAAAPNANELISYNMPAYKLNGFILSFGGWKNHIGLYPIPAGDEAFQKEIAAYKAEKSTIKLPYLLPLPEELLTRWVNFRVEEDIRKAVQKH